MRVIELGPGVLRHKCAPDRPGFRNTILPWTFTRRRASTASPTKDDTRLYLGPARNADLLEVVTIVRDDGSELAIHAMRMRLKYRRLLPGD
jgi:hypothetical protein